MITFGKTTDASELISSFVNSLPFVTYNLRPQFQCDASFSGVPLLPRCADVVVSERSCLWYIDCVRVAPILARRIFVARSCRWRGATRARLRFSPQHERFPQWMGSSRSCSTLLRRAAPRWAVRFDACAHPVRDVARFTARAHSIGAHSVHFSCSCINAYNNCLFTPRGRGPMGWV